jgi:hypothetical protein
MVLWYNCLMRKNNSQSIGSERDSSGDPSLAYEVSSTLDDTADSTRQALDSTSRTTASAKEGPETKTLQDYLKELGADKDRPESLRKLHQLQLVLLDLGGRAKGKIDPKRVLLKPLPGTEIGEAHIEGQYSVIDPTTLNKSDLSTFRHALCHEMVVHVMGKIDDEGLTESRTAQLLWEDAMDYEDLVANSLVVTDTIGKGDRAKGIERAISLYADANYGDLFDEFETAYLKNHPNSKEDEPLQVFQLAFPLLRVSDEGEFGEDEEIRVT